MSNISENVIPLRDKCSLKLEPFVIKSVYACVRVHWQLFIMSDMITRGSPCDTAFVISYYTLAHWSLPQTPVNSTFDWLITIRMGLIKN